jgi:voltage-gated potassium channel
MSDVAHKKSGLSPMIKLQVAVLAFTILIVGGSVGFISIERMSPLDAVYMTVITLSSVGFGEVSPLHPAGKVFVIFLILFGVSLIGFVATVLGEMVVEGQFKELVQRRKMENSIQKMRQHCIVAGYGRVGRKVAQELSRSRANFVVIEKDPSGLAQLSEEGFPHVKGDATDEEVLEHAGIARARTLVSTLPEEAQNVYLALTARHMNAQLKIIARADFEEGEKKLIRAGADHVVIPHVLGGTRMAMAALRPNVVDFMRMATGGEEGLYVEEIVVPSGSHLDGKSLLESNLKQEYGVNIIGLRQENQKLVINPGSQTIINGNDILVLIGHSDNLERLTRSLGS